MDIIIISSPKSATEQKLAEELVETMKNSVPNADVVHINEEVNTPRITENHLRKIARQVKKEQENRLDTQVCFLHLSLDNDRIADIKRIQKEIDSRRSKCIGTSLPPIHFRIASISEGIAAKRTILPSEYVIKLMRNTTDVLTTNSQLQFYAHKINEFVHTWNRWVASILGLKSDTSFVIFDKANLPDDLLHLTTNVPSANVIQLGRRDTSPNCTMSTNWLEEFMVRVEQTTSDNGQVVVYLPRGLPDKFYLPNIYGLTRALTNTGRGIHVATVQKHINMYLETNFGNNHLVRITQISAKNAEEAAEVVANGTRKLNSDYHPTSVDNHSSIVNYAQIILCMLLLCKIIITISQLLTRENNKPKPKPKPKL